MCVSVYLLLYTETEIKKEENTKTDIEGKKKKNRTLLEDKTQKKKKKPKKAIKADTKAVLISQKEHSASTQTGLPLSKINIHAGLRLCITGDTHFRSSTKTRTPFL